LAYFYSDAQPISDPQFANAQNFVLGILRANGCSLGIPLQFCAIYSACCLVMRSIHQDYHTAIYIYVLNYMSELWNKFEEPNSET
jgi:hypothetical protein